MAFINQWWAAIFWVFWSLAMLVAGVGRFRAQAYTQAAQCFVGAVFIGPWFLIDVTPIGKILSLPWIVVVIGMGGALGLVAIIVCGRYEKRSSST